MVDTEPILNGDTSSNGHAHRVLPELVELTAAESQRIPSPGTQRALKAETGKAWDVLVGPDADSADRFQTMIWIHLRRSIPDLRWTECADVDVHIDETERARLDPTKLVVSESSPPSAGSGD